MNDLTMSGGLESTKTGLFTVRLGQASRQPQPIFSAHDAPRSGAGMLMSICSRNGVRVPHLFCSRSCVPQGDGFVLGGGDEGLLDPVDVSGQVRRVGLGVELV